MYIDAYNVTIHYESLSLLTMYEVHFHYQMGTSLDLSSHSGFAEMLQLKWLTKMVYKQNKIFPLHYIELGVFWHECHHVH